MLSTSFEKMTNGMRWVLIIPSALLILAFSALTFAYACMMMPVHTLRTKVGVTEVSSTLNNVVFRTQVLSDYLDIQQNRVNTQLNIIEAKLKLAKTDPNKVIDKNPAQAVAGLVAATQGLKIGLTQISEQQKNLKGLKDDLDQLKQALKKDKAPT